MHTAILYKTCNCNSRTGIQVAEGFHQAKKTSEQDFLGKIGPYFTWMLPHDNWKVQNLWLLDLCEGAKV